MMLLRSLFVNIFLWLLKESVEWCIDSTHKTCKSLRDNNADSYLFTIAIRSPISNESIPVCFFDTDAKRTFILVQWFTLLKNPELCPLLYLV
jgi:hypothetical protein